MRRVNHVVLPLAFWLLVWQLAAMAVDKQLLLPGPWVVLRTLGAVMITGEFWVTTLLTLVRIFAGLAVGVILGTAIAVLTCSNRGLNLLLAPMVKVIRATPVASFILLVMLWVSTGQVPGVISALMVLPVVWGNVDRGIRQTDEKLLELAKAYRFGRSRTLKLIYIPSVAPYFAAGIETALGLAWKAGVAAEVLCRPGRGIGTQVYFSRMNFETPELFSWTAVVILLSFLVETVLVKILRKAVRTYDPSV